MQDLGYSIQDYGMKYNETYASVVVDGKVRPFKIAAVEGKAGDPVLAGFFVNDSGTLDMNVSRIKVTDANVDLSPPKVGMVSYDGRLMYLDRSPRRRYKQGFSLENYQVTPFVTHQGDQRFPNLTHVFNPCNTPLEVAIARTLNTQYGARLTRYTGLVGTGTDQIVVVHRRGTIGKVRDNKLYLLDSMKDLTDTMKRIGFTDIEFVKSEVKDNTEELKAQLLDQMRALALEYVPGLEHVPEAPRDASELRLALERYSARFDESLRNGVLDVTSLVIILGVALSPVSLSYQGGQLAFDYLDMCCHKFKEYLQGLRSRVRCQMIAEENGAVSFVYPKTPNRLAETRTYDAETLKVFIVIASAMNYIRHCMYGRENRSWIRIVQEYLDIDNTRQYLISEDFVDRCISIKDNYGNPLRAAMQTASKNKMNEFEVLLEQARANIGRVQEQAIVQNNGRRVPNEQGIGFDAWQLRHAAAMFEQGQRVPRHVRAHEVIFDEQHEEEDDD